MLPLAIDLYSGLGGWAEGFLAEGHWTNPAENGLKFGGGWWHDATNNLIRKAGSQSAARREASAQIAKIPFPLARHIARVFKPQVE